MGTNYYLLDHHCPSCNRADRVHIGKSSWGWCFALHVYPEESLSSWTDWCARLQQSPTQIVNEYGDSVSYEELVKIVTEREGRCPWDESRQWKQMGYDDEADFHEKNSSLRGPKYLLRHRLNGFCVGHGDGTYDYMIGEFS